MENKEVRLIDANALKDRILSAEDEIITDSAYAIGVHNGLTLAKSILINAPTIDPESLRPHGKWKRMDTTGLVELQPVWNCSACGYPVSIHIAGSKYCPHCGAKMDDIEEDDFDDDFDPGEDWEASRCYECGAYGDDYSTDENGEMVCNCDRCPYNSMNKED